MLTIDAHAWNALPTRLSRMARMCEGFVGVPLGHELCVQVQVRPEQGLRSRMIRGVQRLNMGPRHRVLYVSEREFFSEVRDAGLAVARAESQHYVLHRGPWGVAIPAEPSPRDVVTAARAARAVSKARAWVRGSAPEVYIARARGAGADAPSLSPEQRLRVREVIAMTDRVVAGPDGCLRRVLAECMMVREAAESVILLGLNVRGTGHAYFEGDATSPKYDVTHRFSA